MLGTSGVFTIQLRLYIFLAQNCSQIRVRLFYNATLLDYLNQILKLFITSMQLGLDPE